VRGRLGGALFSPVDAYYSARAAGLRPALLESLGPPTHFGRRTVLGVRPLQDVAVRDGMTVRDAVGIGPPAALFPLLAEVLRDSAGDAGGQGAPGVLPAGGGLFPLWIGFLAYEFARHLGLPTGDPMPGLPEAAFTLYEDGWVWEDGRLVHAPAVPISIEPCPELPLSSPALTRDFPADEFIAGVEEVQERIRAGWVYQVNLSHRFSFPAGDLDPLAFYQRLRRVNPSPFMGLVEGDGWAVVSGSPERLFRLAEEEVSARPIAGTRPRATDPAEDDRLEAEMRASVKEQAEHVMLVDLLRNDLARVCLPGTVHVSEAFTVERYSHVMHLVSEVSGSTQASLGEAVSAIFPGGTITGAPKESVMTEIARLEPVPRGAYTGSLGYVSAREADFNILIRSLTVAGGKGHISAGGGIVIGSDPEEEYLETRHKAQALLQTLAGGRGGVAPAPPRPLRSWRPPHAERRLPARVAFLEAHDSFSYTIVDYLRTLGATVYVIDHLETPDLRGATHVVLGPGPGEPATSGRMLGWVAAAVAARLPLLGVCLGHQAIGVHFDARLGRAPRPVHGEAHDVVHTGAGLFEGIPSPAPFTRYHSLHVAHLPPQLTRQAWTDDGVVMAISHSSLPVWGVQFHPESMLSPYGLTLLANFLATSG
jgi:anthranilate synthase